MLNEEENAKNNFEDIISRVEHIRDWIDKGVFWDSIDNPEELLFPHLVWNSDRFGHYAALRRA